MRWADADADAIPLNLASTRSSNLLMAPSSVIVEVTRRAGMRGCRIQFALNDDGVPVVAAIDESGPFAAAAKGQAHSEDAFVNVMDTVCRPHAALDVTAKKYTASALPSPPT